MLEGFCNETSVGARYVFNQSLTQTLQQCYIKSLPISIQQDTRRNHSTWKKYKVLIKTKMWFCLAVSQNSARRCRLVNLWSAYSDVQTAAALGGNLECTYQVESLDLEQYPGGKQWHYTKKGEDREIINSFSTFQSISGQYFWWSPISSLFPCITLCAFVTGRGN